MKFHVEFDYADSPFQSISEVEEEMRACHDAENITVTVLGPVATEGWYRYNNSFDHEVLYWTATKIEDYGVENFLSSHTRMQEPQVWIDPDLPSGPFKWEDLPHLDVGAVVQDTDGDHWTLQENGEWTSDHWGSPQDPWKYSPYMIVSR